MYCFAVCVYLRNVMYGRLLSIVCVLFCSLCLFKKCDVFVVFVIFSLPRLDQMSG